MQSKKTHAQHLILVEKQENISNAGADFDIRRDLDRGQAVKDALADGAPPRGVLRELARNRGMIHGLNQASHHRKRSGN